MQVRPVNHRWFATASNHRNFVISRVGQTSVAREERKTESRPTEPIQLPLSQTQFFAKGTSASAAPKAINMPALVSVDTLFGDDRYRIIGLLCIFEFKVVPPITPISSSCKPNNP